MKFSVFQISRKGGRERNEDRMGYCYTRESGLFVLADGMGGHPEGEVAAQLALQTISAIYQQEARPAIADTAEFLTNALMAAYAGTDRLLDYVEVFEAMLDGEQHPRRELFRADGLHMNPAGYALWHEMIAKHID